MWNIAVKADLASDIESDVSGIVINFPVHQLKWNFRNFFSLELMGIWDPCLATIYEISSDYDMGFSYGRDNAISYRV